MQKQNEETQLKKYLLVEFNGKTFILNTSDKRPLTEFAKKFNAITKISILENCPETSVLSLSEFAQLTTLCLSNVEEKLPNDNQIPEINIYKELRKKRNIEVKSFINEYLDKNKYIDSKIIKDKFKDFDLDSNYISRNIKACLQHKSIKDKFKINKIKNGCYKLLPLDSNYSDSNSSELES